ncbi:MAG: histidine phosphatase family protein [bacterium]|nr:histidine phosphatase family protein [bacterium]
MTSRVFVVRHVERDKANTADPQTPTALGEIQAYAMGMEVRRKYNPNFRHVRSSPQPRAIRTANIFMAGVAGFQTAAGAPPVSTEENLNDFSTDGRTIVADGVKEAKTFGKRHGLEIEQSIFLSPIHAPAALQTKCKEMQNVLYKLGLKEGDSLMCVHGAAIDAVAIWLHMYGKQDAHAQFEHGVIGEMIDKAEGFVATFEDGRFVSVEMIRQPAWLKALAFMNV